MRGLAGASAVRFDRSVDLDELGRPLALSVERKPEENEPTEKAPVVNESWRALEPLPEDEDEDEDEGVDVVERRLASPREVARPVDVRGEEDVLISDSFQSVGQRWP